MPNSTGVSYYHCVICNGSKWLNLHHMLFRMQHIAFYMEYMYNSILTSNASKDLRGYLVACVRIFRL